MRVRFSGWTTVGVLRAAGVAAAAIGVLVALSLLAKAIDTSGAAAQVRQLAGPPAVRALVLYVIGLVAGCALFPMSVFAVICGLAVGTWAGIPLTIAVAASTAAIEQRLGRMALARRRFDRLEPLVDRVRPLVHEHGLVTVLTVRLAPLLPFALTNYALGAFDLRSRDVFVGTAIAVTPRTILLIGATNGVLGSAGLFSAPGLLLGALPALVGLILVGLVARAIRRAQAPAPPP